MAHRQHKEDDGFGVARADSSTLRIRLTIDETFLTAAWQNTCARHCRYSYVDAPNLFRSAVSVEQRSHCLHAEA